MRRAIVTLVAATALAGCTGQNAETRAREAEKKIKESIPDIVGAALEQQATPEQIKQTQEALKALNEYQGEANGKLDPVTVSAIQAFQRARGLKADGMLTDKTTRLLQDAAAKAKEG